MENLFTPPKHATGTLVGVDGNAFSLMGYFRRAAKSSGWTNEEINLVIEAAMDSDYNNLISILNVHLRNN